MSPVIDHQPVRLLVRTLIGMLLLQILSPVPRTYADSWSVTGSMTIPRAGHTATLLRGPTPQVLAVGGVMDRGCESSVEIYDPGPGRWSPAPRMNRPRCGHTATLLPTRVLVAGGSGGPDAETFAPWSFTGPMREIRRFGHTATLLNDGRVLVAGGEGNFGPLSSAEIYDPDTDAWSDASAMSDMRDGHTAALLTDGTVLVAGGLELASAEIYDPSTDTWSPAASMNDPRGSHTATMLANGQVLVVGGVTSVGCGPFPSCATGKAEIYDPGTDTWVPAATMPTFRWGHTATLLPDGRVLAVGGRDVFTPALPNAEIYTP